LLRDWISNLADLITSFTKKEQLFSRSFQEKIFYNSFLSCHFFTAIGTGTTFFRALLANFTVKLRALIRTGFT